jgi:hypothetical protein
LNQMPEGSALLDGLKRVLDGKAVGSGVATTQRLQPNQKNGGAVKKG